MQQYSLINHSFSSKITFLKMNTLKIKILTIIVLIIVNTGLKLNIKNH